MMSRRNGLLSADHGTQKGRCTEAFPHKLVFYAPLARTFLSRIQLLFRVNDSGYDEKVTQRIPGHVSADTHVLRFIYLHKPLFQGVDRMEGIRDKLGTRSIFSHPDNTARIL